MVFIINEKVLFSLSVLLCLVSIISLFLSDLFFSGIIFVISLALSAKVIVRLGIKLDFKKKINKLSWVVILFFAITLIITFVRSAIGYGLPSDIIVNVEYILMIWSGLSWMGLFASNFLLIALDLKLINRLN
jgi:hypothetical protein